MRTLARNGSLADGTISGFDVCHQVLWVIHPAFLAEEGKVLDDSLPLHEHVLTEQVLLYTLLISLVICLVELIATNLHKHTDIQEYIGSYATNPETRCLCCKEGALVCALQQGAWVVLDELNLAPSDVAEAFIGRQLGALDPWNSRNLELEVRWQTHKIFEPKHSSVPLRGLFGWGGRGAVGYQELTEENYMSLAKRSRGGEEKETVKEVLEELMNVTINPDHLYRDVQLPKNQVATTACKRSYKLVPRCLQFNKSLPLVEDAGSGKTSVCKALSLLADHCLRSINLHRNSEVGYLLGIQHPICIMDGSHVKDVINTTEQALAEKRKLPSDPKIVNQAQTALSQLTKSTGLLDWSDGPSIQAWQEEDFVLLDKISLADDSVLERLNGSLEPKRLVVLAERGSESLGKMQIRAHPVPQIFATMNPGGDVQKIKLFPALGNRFTEI
ncbi:hypothetical protein PSTT_03132 [Puccinia striiformis]|uniref:ATPase dynein-related AAA domain-containing protein n=1 Tax=Puccinia striiformis TaxID=27350 RepID=A0A2S4VXP8_9BASI|nr:hypothetical protein PSTT_03132 [Puccinia striiformis]